MRWQLAVIMTRMSLGGGDLTGTNLAGTDLVGTDLVGTDLAGSDLVGSVLGVALRTVPSVMLFAVAAALAATARVILTRVANTGTFPWGTLAVNTLGSLLAGLVAHRVPDAFTTIVVTAALGSFTTFSTFAVETTTLFRERRPTAVAYALGTTFAAVAAAFTGLAL